MIYTFKKEINFQGLKLDLILAGFEPYGLSFVAPDSVVLDYLTPLTDSGLIAVSDIVNGHDKNGLSSSKSDKIELVKAKTKSLKSKGFTSLSSNFSLDTQSLLLFRNIREFADEKPSKLPVFVRDTKGAPVELNALSDCTTLRDDGEYRLKYIEVEGKDLIDAILAATSQAGLDIIVDNRV